MLTHSEQLLLLEILLKKKITKSTQSIFKSIKFYNAVSKLKKFGLIESRTKNGENIYLLTYPNGWVRANSISYDKNTPEKYKRVSKEFYIIPD